MKIALKNVKTCKFASQETKCFEASLYIDGKRVAVVGNSGTGCPNYYHFKDRELEQKFYSYCRGLPPVEVEFGGVAYKLKNNADMVIGKIVDEMELQKEYKRMCKKGVVFKLKKDEENSFRILETHNLPLAKTMLDKKYGDELDYILNERI